MLFCKMKIKLKATTTPEYIAMLGGSVKKNFSKEKSIVYSDIFKNEGAGVLLVVSIYEDEEKVYLHWATPEVQNFLKDFDSQFAVPIETKIYRELAI